MSNNHPILIHLDQNLWEFLEKIAKDRRRKKAIKEEREKRLPATVTGLIKEAIYKVFENEPGFPHPDTLGKSEYIPALPKSLEERFWEKVEKTSNIDDCWTWKSNSTSKDGYGLILYNSKKVLAHRISYMLSHSLPDLPVEAVYRKCQSRLCVNPNHLYTKSELLGVKPEIQAFINKLQQIENEEIEEEEKQEEIEIRKKLEREKAKERANNLLKALED